MGCGDNSAELQWRVMGVGQGRYGARGYKDLDHEGVCAEAAGKNCVVSLR